MGGIVPAGWLGQGMGTLLGIAMVGVAIVLLVRGHHSPRTLPRLRRASQRLLLMTGILVLAGTWVNPANQPRLFIVVWIATTACVLGLIVLSVVELATVRQRTHRELRRLFDENQRQLRLELHQLNTLGQPSPPPTPPPGLSPHENN